MSYILDALRKSDQQRQRGAAPTLLAAQAAVVPRRPAPLSYGLVALVLVSVGVAIGWLRPWQSEQEAPAVRLAATPPVPAPSQPAPVPPEPAIKSGPEARLPSAAPAARPAPLPIPTKPHIPASAAPAKPGTPYQAATEVSRKSADPVQEQRVNTGVAAAKPDEPHQATAEVSRKAVDPSPEPSLNTGAAAVAPAQSVMSMAELPVSIQQDLPPMSIMVHAYSAKPADRLVGINNRLLHEGDDVAPGLKLEQITPDGMILNFRGYSFRRGVR